MSFNQWQTHTLETLVDSSSTITYGVVKPGLEDSGGVKFIRGGDIINGKILVENLRTITKEVSDQYKRTLLRGGELVVSLVGNPGQVSIVPQELEGANIARQVGLIRLRKDIDSEYVKYFLMSPLGKERLFAKSVGSVQQVINLSDLRELQVQLPDEKTQRRISSILSSLDYKIELNRQTNQTLEAIVQAIFKEWFVDFSFPGATGESEASATPEKNNSPRCELVESELGMIPKRWMVGCVGDLFEISKDTTNPSLQKEQKFVHYSLPAYDEGKKPIIECGADILSNKFTVKSNSILVSKLNPRIPRIWRILDAEDNAICSTEFLPLMPKQQSAFSFGASLFWQQSIIEVMKGRASGTSGSHQRVRPQDVLDIEIIIPDSEVLKAYDSVVRSIFIRIKNSEDENLALTELRDALLPKLMNGEITTT